MNEWDEKRRVMRRYDLTAHMYDMRYSEEQSAKIEAALGNVNIGKHSLVLDVGCGTGILLDYVADKAETVVELDISRKVLREAKKRARSLQNVHLILADSDHLPLKRAFFSHVFAVTLIQNTPNPVKTLNETKRVAGDGAAIVVTGLKKAFPLKTFEEILQNAGLKPITLKEKDLKCYVAVCAKIFTR